MKRVAFSVVLETREKLTTAGEKRLFQEISKTITAVMKADARVAMVIKSGKPQQQSLFLKLFPSTF